MSVARKPRVVVIDDDEAISDAITLLMQQCGWAATRYRSCEDFIEEIDKDDAPVCLVLDLYFKGMSGVELQQFLAKKGMKIPTIVLTAWPDGALTRLAVEAGAMEILTKPVSSDQLVRTIETIIASARATTTKNE